MIFQKVLKGIKDLDQSAAQHIIDNGIMCNWWRKVGAITPGGIKQHLNSINADLHLNHYHKPVPAGNPLAIIEASSFGDVSPFISTTAGVIQRDTKLKKNVLFDPFMTAIRFATNNFTTNGYIFYAYLITIGKVAIEMEQFSEEIRELHIYKEYLPYHKQGEIMAKILIPSVQIEKAHFYDGPQAKKDLDAGKMPTPEIIPNTSYQAPEKLSNIREVLS